MHCDGKGHCIHNNFVYGWTNGKSCGGVQKGFGYPAKNHIGNADTRFQCGLIGTKKGVTCCSMYDKRCYEGSSSGWVSWPSNTGWWAVNY